MKQFRTDRPRARRDRWPEAIPLDPRDPDVVRVKALARAAAPRQHVTGRAVTAPEPADASGLTVPGTATQGKAAATGTNG